MVFSHLLALTDRFFVWLTRTGREVEAYEWCFGRRDVLGVVSPFRTTVQDRMRDIYWGHRVLISLDLLHQMCDTFLTPSPADASLNSHSHWISAFGVSKIERGWKKFREPRATIHHL